MRFKSRWIPKDSIEVNHPQGLGVAFVYRLRDKYAVLAYSGKRTKSDFHFVYPTIEKAHDRIESWFSSLEKHVELVNDRRKQSFAPHTFTVGDIVTNSWGYDQTNVDWYRVTRTSASFVWLIEICGQTEQNGFMSGHSTPAIDTTGADASQWGFCDKKDAKEFRRKASGSNVCMKYGSGSKWDGKARYESWYA